MFAFIWESRCFICHIFHLLQDSSIRGRDIPWRERRGWSCEATGKIILGQICEFALSLSYILGFQKLKSPVAHHWFLWFSVDVRDPSRTCSHERRNAGDEYASWGAGGWPVSIPTTAGCSRSSAWSNSREKKMKDGFTGDFRFRSRIDFFAELGMSRWLDHFITRRKTWHGAGCWAESKKTHALSAGLLRYIIHILMARWIWDNASTLYLFSVPTWRNQTIAYW